MEYILFFILFFVSFWGCVGLISLGYLWGSYPGKPPVGVKALEDKKNPSLSRMRWLALAGVMWGGILLSLLLVLSIPRPTKTKVLSASPMFEKTEIVNVDDSETTIFDEIDRPLLPPKEVLKQK